MERLPFLDIPIVGAPMAGAGTTLMAAAISNEGGLGSLACGYLKPDAIRSAIRETRERTQRPFAVNLFALERGAVDTARVARAHAALKPYRDELGIDAPTPPEIALPSFDEQFAVVLDEAPAVFSFTFGIPSRDALARCRERGIFTIGTATSVDEARALERAGVDAVCAQGYEAGGHRGAFLHDDERGLIGTVALVPRVVDAVDIPVIASGGIGDGRAVAAVLALGADAAQLGSAFLLATDAATAGAWRTIIEERPDTTAITTAFSGRAARGIRKRFADEMRDAEIAPYPAQHVLTRDLRDAAARAGAGELLSPWAGQAVGLARTASSAEIVRALVREAADAAKRAVEKL